MPATLVKDKTDEKVWRVESIDDDGGVEVAIFSGPNAYNRAVCYCDAYYDEYDDETGQYGVAGKQP